jgi:hypothetical protein
MLEKVVTGGQTGADQAGWRAARAFGIPTGGYMPLGFLTEAGPRPGFAELYGAVEMRTAAYPPRTEANVRETDATLWFGNPDTPGGKATLHACAGMGRPRFIVARGDGIKPSDVAEWIRSRGVKVLNVAGNRESAAPGIGARVERFLREVFRQLGHEPPTPPRTPQA